jgi:hypothetical protein
MIYSPQLDIRYPLEKIGEMHEISEIYHSLSFDR